MTDTAKTFRGYAAMADERGAILEKMRYDEAVGAIERLTRERDDAIERLRAIIRDAMQRLNESGTGHSGLLETIHATHSILRAYEQVPR